MRYIVALTGGIGSGKSTVANAFADLGINVIDADIIARQVVEPGAPALHAIADHFGANMIAADGSYFPLCTVGCAIAGRKLTV